MTPEEVEVGRRNLIAELRDGEAGGMDVSAEMVRDLIAVLEASAPVQVDREALYWAISEASERQGVAKFLEEEDIDAFTTAVLALLSPEATK